MNQKYCIGIDVGTGSVRAGIFDLQGNMTASSSHPIKIFQPQTDFVEQSSDDIWKSTCNAVESALKESGISPGDIKGIGFDATCSLVCLDKKHEPLSVSPTGKSSHNIIVWMDHRAVNQAERINATKHEVLKYVGNVISPEMEPPKLLWLKENLPETWEKTGKFFDLADFMTWRATGVDVRSLCTTVCKWTYQGHRESRRPDSVGAWDASFWNEIGLDDLTKDHYEKIGQVIRPMGDPVGKGLTEKAARDLHLVPGTPVGVGIIDAHAGGLGMLGAGLSVKKHGKAELEKRLALICGTSSCHMAVSKKPLFIEGIWGPYYSAMIPEFWLTEGGQSATGALIDHCIFSHARARDLQKQSIKESKTIYEILNDTLERLSQHVAFPAILTKERHVWPHHHGNRSPLADPTLRGIHTGLKLDDSIEELALQYLATIQGIAYGTRHIIEEMNSEGYQIETIFACGGVTRNPVFLREHADITGCRIIIPKEPEAVLLGSAILGAVASGEFPDVFSTMNKMNHTGEIIEPSGGRIKKYHDKKYQVYREMYSHFLKYREIMA